MTAHSSRNVPWVSLLPKQWKALQHIEALAARLGPGARENIKAILQRTGLNESAYEGAIESVQSHGRVALHFHPERLCGLRMTVAEGLLETGECQSQFETGLSSGSPTAYAAGSGTSGRAACLAARTMNRRFHPPAARSTALFT
jgi:hypothetical protein